MDAYIIIGKRRAGKSSLARGLTGIRDSDQRLMHHPINGFFKLFAHHTSLQEANISPLAFIQKVQALGVDAVLLTLVPNANLGFECKYLPTNSYIHEFQSAGWNIQPWVQLERVTQLPITLPPGTFYNLPGKPFNMLMAEVRQYWNWA